MKPMLSTGDRIMVDTSRRVPAPPGIFVIWDDMGIVAKRIEHVPHSDPIKVIINSLNREYQTYERNAEEVNMIGRVVWASKRL
jgi:phage repressor protein C with HTH and peptisase S24 domain